VTDSANIEKLDKGCLQCLLYFGIFEYPLNINEIHQFNPCRATIDEIQASLERLKANGKVFQEEEFFLTENATNWVEKRKLGYTRALDLLKQSGKYVSVIASFPFVEGIAISGSLSKYHVTDDADIDYFIITKANRLWIARSFLHFFKKLTFISGHQHYYCMNYFVDTRALSLEQRNPYTAIELATLIPVYNRKLVENLMRENQWISDFLPNHPGLENFDYLIDKKKGPLKSFFEGLLNLLFPKSTNKAFMKLTDKKWRKKWRGAGFSDNEYNRALQTETHVSKNHPVDYEKLVLDKLSQHKEKQTAGK
jgi:hypothetical protein